MDLYNGIGRANQSGPLGYQFLGQQPRNTSGSNTFNPHHQNLVGSPTGSAPIIGGNHQNSQLPGEHNYYMLNSNMSQSPTRSK